MLYRRVSTRVHCLEDVSEALVGKRERRRRPDLHMKDRFSKQASAYAAFRPTYPKSLYDFVLSHVGTKHIAWDCATGNGQVARDLGPYFKEVFATDSSVDQIKKAAPAENIYYSVC